ncbi:MAG: threonine/serine exporter family protein [Phycisphaeraceae bacterium]|nr:threonine/serine exporter family protein [Phycisphaeraceae bacterium]
MSADATSPNAPAAPPSEPSINAPELLEFMVRLAQAYLACGEQTAQVELSLRRVASAMGVRRSRVVAFPTAIFISLHAPDREHVTIAEGPIQMLRLDQIGQVYSLGTEAQRAGALTPTEGFRRLNEVLRQTPRFGAVGSVAGHTVLAAGLAIVLGSSIENLIAASGLGLIIGLLKVANRNRPILAAPLPVVAAAIVSAIVYFAMGRGYDIDPLHALIPPLITFLPGAMLTFGMIELAYGDMVSGSSRLLTGAVQLVLLAFGLAAGAILVGVTAEQMLLDTQEWIAPAWLPWLGVAVFIVGVCIHFSAPARALPWMLLVALLTFATQRLAATTISPVTSGFFGMLVATPVGYLIQQRFRGPPSMVTFLPSFWLLVPGSLSLMSVTRLLSDRPAGFDGLADATFAIVSIALGTLVGASLYKWLTDQFGWWQLRVGRVGRLFGRGQ